jgi:pycsar effector protein
MPRYNPTMTPEQRIPLLEKILDRQLAWITSANTRVSVALSLSTAMLTALAAVFPEKIADLSTLATAAWALAALSLGRCVLMCTFVVFPRLRGPKQSAIYFARIAEGTPDQYAAAMQSLELGAYLSDLTAQIHVNASIADLKFRFVQRSMKALFASLAPWLLAILLLSGA